MRTTFKNIIEEKAMGISDVINLKEISGKINVLLLSHKDDEIDIFISPGTPTMQVAWYLAHESLGLNTKLFQLRRAEHSKDGIPEKVVVEMEKSSYTSALIIKQDNQNTIPDYKGKLILGSLKKVYQKADKIASADNVGVLILGDTGTGKEFLAKYIHENSIRSKKPFIPLNCSAMGDSLIESRMFGYAKGAHNTAFIDQKGLFEEADGGTIFLDEIGDISPYIQQVLLRVLQEKEVQRIGEAKIRKVDIRIIAATNRDLHTLCTENKFRWDLYYRLAVSVLKIPSFKDYTESDKEDMFSYLWKKGLKKINTNEPKLSKEVKRRIFEYSFPGNIREMENIIDGLLAEAEHEIQLSDLPERMLEKNSEQSLKLIDVRNNHIKKVYEMFDKNGRKASRILGISYNNLKSKLEDDNTKKQFRVSKKSGRPY